MTGVGLYLAYAWFILSNKKAIGNATDNIFKNTTESVLKSVDYVTSKTSDLYNDTLQSAEKYILNNPTVENYLDSKHREKEEKIKQEYKDKIWELAEELRTKNMLLS